MKITYLLCFWAFFISSCEYLPKSIINPEKNTFEQSVVGSWELLSFKGVTPSGRVHYPYDTEVKGIAFFTDENNFSIQLYDATRPRLSNKDPFFCSDPEIRIAFLSERSCFGNYEVSIDSIHFYINGANLPNLSGIKETRYYELHGDTMLLVSPIRRLNGILLAEHSIWIYKGRKVNEQKQPRWYYYQPRQ